MHRVLAAAAAATIGITVLGATGAAIASQPGGQPRATQHSGVRTGSVLRFNVGATHSPAIERLLAGRAAVAARASARPAV